MTITKEIKEGRLDAKSMLKTALRDRYEGRKRFGVHVSDLLLCLRKAVRHRINPAPLRNIDLRNFTQGESHHNSIQALFKQMRELDMNVKLVNAEKDMKYKGIIGHADVFILYNGNVVIEMKGSRSSKATPSLHYISQNETYLSILDADYGIIIVESYNSKDEETVWEQYFVDMTPEQKVARLTWLETRANIFTHALDKKDWFVAPHVIDDPDQNWACRQCPYSEECYKHEGYNIQMEWNKGSITKKFVKDEKEKMKLVIKTTND